MVLSKLEDALRFADIICLYAEGALGYVYSYQSSTADVRQIAAIGSVNCFSSVHSELAVLPNQSRTVPSIADPKMISFQLEVPDMYKLNKKYRKLKAKYSSIEDDLSVSRALLEAKSDAETEIAENKAEQQRQWGKVIYYGQVVQLKHMYTNKYVHISTTNTSLTEANSMRVLLCDYNAKHAHFRVMPRYKIKAEGDVVHVNDQLILESVKSSGQCLHVSDTYFGGGYVYSDSYELNLSVGPSSFTIYRRRSPSKTDDNYILANSPVQIFHKAIEACMSAEGVFVEKSVGENVHFRVKSGDLRKPTSMKPSTSAIIYWQIELENDVISGQEIRWLQHCRIKHMVTRKYLFVDNNGVVSLTDDRLDPNTVFLLHPVTNGQSNLPVQFGSHCRIQHAVSECWLKALDGESTRCVDGESTRCVDGESTRSVDGESTRSVDGESTRCVDGESTRSVDGEPTRSVDGESTRSVDGESTRSVDGESTKSVDGESTRSVDGESTRMSLHWVVQMTIDEIGADDVGVADEGVDLETYERRDKLEEDVDHSSMAGIIWTKATLRKIGVSSEPGYCDVLMLRKVRAKYLSMFNYVAGMVPFIHKCIADKKDDQILTISQINVIVTALRELREFMTVNETTDKNRQKLLRNLRVVDLIVELLQTYTRGAPDQQSMDRVVVECYGVLRAFLEGCRRKNELYLAIRLPLFDSQMAIEGQIGLNAVKMIIELIGENRKIVDRINHGNIDHFISLLAKTQNYSYLHLLGELCVCDDVAIPDNQKYIAESWLVRPAQTLQRCTLYYIELGDSINMTPSVVYISTDDAATWRPLDEFVSQVTDLI
ncbi:Inositol 1,4,5-trisphosphate receptor [Lamellibrachia satsuma]|nr:Inositol 1,4,5-trisphosphate receptor [Lamellibrachia satsuma]